MNVLLSWSSGKDSAWALHVLRKQGVNVAGLLTTVNEQFARVAMHGVRQALLESQARAAGLPLMVVPLPWPCSNEEYERRMSVANREIITQGYAAVAFGDLFLEDVRAYREAKLRGTGLDALFPLWQLDTTRLAREMVASGLKARVSCVDPRGLDRSFAGREFDTTMLDALPPTVDPCGERGEFHTFCYDGPMFSAPITVETGELVERDGFVYADLIASP